MQGLFAPPEQISAACMLETLYFYALAHQNDFDVSWCRWVPPCLFGRGYFDVKGAIRCLINWTTFLKSHPTCVSNGLQRLDC